MCLTPGKLADGTEFACRKCWQCQERRIDDWVGRCIAENKTAVAAHSITLTYGRDEYGNEDHMRSAWLTYSDVQKFFKLLRFDGYKFRYIVCGEYGSTKGRAHWHLIMFWQGKVPPHELTVTKRNERRFENKYWPHGFQHWEKPSPASIRYVCKYIQKDIGKAERQGHLSMSKKPPLGFDYFRDLAGRYVSQGLAPQDLTYKFADVYGKDGTRKVFHMSGTTAHNYIEQYKAAWLRQRGGFWMMGSRHGQDWPNSVLIDEHDDKIARADYFPEKERFHRLKAPWGGSGPFLGHDPLLKQQRAYSDDDSGRWWYRPTEDGYAWQRENATSETGQSPEGTQYRKASRGEDGNPPPPPSR